MKLQPAMVFGSHMVLQRQQPIPVWGKGAEGDTVTVTLGNDTVSAVVIDSKWQVEFPAREAETGLTMTISTAKTAECITFNDVAIGEVWLAGGQSNMEFLLKYDIEADTVVPSADDPLLRCFDFPEAAGPLQLQIGRYEDYGFWRPLDSENAPWFSAVGYWFGAQLRKALNVPVGILACNWGGTVASTWTSKETLEADPVFQPVLDHYAQMKGSFDWELYYNNSVQQALADPKIMRQFTDRMLMGLPMPMPPAGGERKFTPPPIMIGPMSANAPGALYETMVKSVAPYGARGIIWYQGESDEQSGWSDFYDASLKAMHSDWCKLWGKELPLMQVMLAPFHHWAMVNAERYFDLRAQQKKLADTEENFYVANIMDHGGYDNIHPRDKRWAGERLSRLARKYIYGEDILADSPSLESVEWLDGKAIVNLKNAEGLHLTGENIDTLELLQNGEAVDFSAQLEGNTMVITSAAITADAKLELRYAWQNYCIVNCYNAAELPVFPFKVEK